MYNINILHILHISIVKRNWYIDDSTGILTCWFVNHVHSSLLSPQVVPAAVEEEEWEAGGTGRGFDVCLWQSMGLELLFWSFKTLRVWVRWRGDGEGTVLGMGYFVFTYSLICIQRPTDRRVHGGWGWYHKLILNKYNLSTNFHQSFLIFLKDRFLFRTVDILVFAFRKKKNSFLYGGGLLYIRNALIWCVCLCVLMWFLEDLFSSGCHHRA